MSAPFSDHIATLCEEAGIDADAIKISTKSSIPPGDGPWLVITDTGGASSIRTHNSAPRRAYDRPSVQVRVHAMSYQAGMAMAQTAFDYIEQVRDREIDGVWYREIQMSQSAPFDMGLDDSKRSRVAFNAMAVKRPS